MIVMNLSTTQKRMCKQAEKDLLKQKLIAQDLTRDQAQPTIETLGEETPEEALCLEVRKLGEVRSLEAQRRGQILHMAVLRVSTVLGGAVE